MGQEHSSIRKPKNKEYGIAWFDPKINHSIKGKVVFLDGKCWVKLSGMKPNTVHAIHIHQSGDLSNGCMSTGGHYNPTNKNHGSYLCPGRGRHVGDLMNNITSNKKGRVSIVFKDPKIKLQDIIGRAIVIHDLQDDLGRQGIEKEEEVIPYHKLSIKELVKLVRERKYKVRRTKKAMADKLESLKTGNAGGRMACAVIGRGK